MRFGSYSWRCCGLSLMLARYDVLSRDWGWGLQESLSPEGIPSTDKCLPQVPHAPRACTSNPSPVWRGGRRRHFRSSGAKRTGWKFSRPVFTPRLKGRRRFGAVPAYPDGLPPDPPSRSRCPTPQKKTCRGATRKADDQLSHLWLRRHLMSSPDAQREFFGRVRERRDRYHDLVRSNPRITPTIPKPPRHPEGRRANRFTGSEPAFDPVKLAPLIELVRPIPVFNGQNHRPGKGHYTAPKNDARARRQLKQDAKLVKLRARVSVSQDCERSPSPLAW